ncbi:MAG: methyltransferase [Deferribacteraceae bacterium]|jgi:tRNA1Val (adenine37-N6)-methyltransferase|nr:methyltransferase [Deferribacteraceae bacterium]
MSFDRIIRNDICISQPDKGFRFGLDSCILAWFASVKRKDALLEIGAGSGVVSVLLAKLKGVRKIISVELQEGLYSHLLETVELNGLKQVIAPIHADIRGYKPNVLIDFIIANPPYRKSKSGFISEDAAKRSARFDDDLSLEDIFAFAFKNLRFGGKLAFSGVAERLTDALAVSRKYNLEPKRLQLLYSSDRKGGKLFFLENVYGGKAGLKILPPLWPPDKNNPDETCPYNLILQGDWS